MTSVRTLLSAAWMPTSKHYAILNCMILAAPATKMDLRKMPTYTKFLKTSHTTPPLSQKNDRNSLLK